MSGGGSRKGERRGGRKKGTPNKVGVTLKEAILAAAAKVGENGRGRDGLEGYLKFLAREEPRTFGALLGRVLPMQLTGENGGPIDAKLVVEFV